MQWSKIPKSRLFLRYFGSYLIVFLVPVLFLFTIISIMYVRSIEEELTTINENMLQQVSEQVDEQITKITSVGNQINYSRSFSPYFIDDTNNYEKNVNELKLYNNSMAYADSMYIVINDQDLVISPDGIISIEGLLTNRTEFIVKEKEKMTNNIHSVEAGISVYSLDRIGDIHNDVKVVHYLMPLEGPQKNYGSIIFVLDMDYIESTLYTNADNNRIAVILDDEGNIVYTNGNIDEISEMGLSQVMINNLSDDISNFSHEGYVISQHSNELTDWTLLTLTETQQIYTPFIQALFVVFIFLLIFILIGVSLAIYFSNKNYEPLEQLTNIFSLENGDGQDVIKDEWSYIRKNIIEKQDETELLNARLSEQEHIIRENLLLNLLEGNPNIGNNELESQNIQFSNAFYSVLIIEFQEKLKGSQNVLNINNIAFEINEYTNKSVQIETTVPYKANNKIIAILNFEKDHQSLWDSILKKIESILEQFKYSEYLNWKITVGNTYESIEKINNSYIEASSILNETELKKSENTKILFFRDVIKQKELNHSQYFIKYPDEEMLILAQSLKSGNKERTIEVLDLVLVDIYKNKENGIHLQVLVADVLNLMLKTATELELENTTPIYQETAKLSDFKNYNDVKIVLNSIAHLICNSVQKEDKKISNNIEQQVVEFIYSNYNSLDISLEQIASEFNISISYVSKLIKDETGESFSSIIQNLRMDLFKDLLLNTDKPIKNLVKEIGYYDVSNFTRKFKNENNITPSQYRKKYSN